MNLLKKENEFNSFKENRIVFKTMHNVRVANGGPGNTPIEVIDTYGNVRPNNVWGNSYFVDNVGGSASGNGLSKGNACNTITLGVAKMSAHDNLYIKGTSTDYEENVVCTLDNVSFIGEGFGVEVGGWKPAAQNGANLTLSGARGSTVSGFLFRGNGTTGKAIDISETVANDSDSITILNNVFKSTTQDVGSHIFANGIPGYITVVGNQFTHGVAGINATAADTTSGYGWKILGNHFSDKCSTKGIYMPLHSSLIKGNSFGVITTACSTVGYSGTNGDYNDVHGNNFAGAYSEAGGYYAQTNDDWSGNYNMGLTYGITLANPA